MSFLIILVLVVIIAGVGTAYAITRDEVDNIQSQIKESQTRIGQLDIGISVQKIGMADAEKALKDAKEVYRQVKKKEGKSWDFLPNIAAATLEIDNAVQNINATKSEYFSLLKQKSDEIKNIKSLRELLKTDIIFSNSTTVAKKIMSIQISQKCELMIKNNFNTTCPDYKDLRYLDTSDKVSGEFGIFNGIYQRGPPVYAQSWIAYRYDDTHRIFIDPPLGMAERFPLIIIESNLDTFLQPDSKVMIQNYITLNQSRPGDAWGKNSTFNTLMKTTTLPVADNSGNRIIYHDLFADKKCRVGLVNANNWRVLLPIMIDHLGNGCTSSLNNTEIITKNYTTHDISTTQKYKHDVWIKSVSKNLKIGNDNSTNSSVTEDKMSKYKPKIHPPFAYP